MIDDEYVDRVLYVIEGSTIRKKELKDDLADHFCCLIEMDMKNGIDFDTALRRAQDQTCPNGLDEIQRETIFLLNYNKIIIMKRFTYLIGFLGSISLLASVFFKLMNLPQANLLGVIGALTLVFIFLPLLLINRYKRLASQVASERWKWIMGVSSAVIFGVATVFKLMHLQGAGVMLGLSFILFGIGFLPFLFFKMYKESVEEI